MSRVIHIIAPYVGDSPLRQRQEMFLQSISAAKSPDVTLLAASRSHWSRPGWELRPLPRTAGELGDPSDKPFLKDLFDIALEESRPGDWLLYSNVDCSFAPDLYSDLAARKATVVEYQRRDVEGHPETLDQLFSNPWASYSIGLDAFAIRASLYREVRDQLPDFVVGEPHWDTIYSGFFRRLLPVQRDGDRLFHPKHQQAWDLAHPTQAGRHNHELFVESLYHGLAEKSLIEEAPNRTDTAIVVAVFGSDPARIQANVAGIREQLQQDLYADTFLVELIVGDSGSAYPGDLLKRVNHLPVPASEASDGLFQKEALYNWGWRTALKEHDYKYFIFVDADVYCDQRDWFRRIRGRLQENPARAVQGWRVVRDTIDPELLYSSLGANFVFDQPTDLPLNPGMCWGLHRGVLEMGDGFNPYCLDCSGDSAFVAEYLNNSATQYDPWLYQWGWFREIERKLPYHVELDCVPLDLVHVHHGPLKERNYDGFRYALDALPPLQQLVRLNGNGILEWKDRDCTERRILSERASMGSHAAVDELLHRFDYPKYSRPPKRSRERETTKQPFRVLHHGRRPPFVNRPGSETAKERTGVKIFAPEEIFRKDFPFSWCDGIIKPEGSTYAPLRESARGAVLFLDGKPGAPYVVCALPLQATWLPVDVSSRAALRFAARVTGTPPDVCVTLVSQTRAGIEMESRQISLKSEGLAYGRWMELSISLAQVADTVDLSCVRLVKFLGDSSFRLELARVYIE
jgi:hypothetical protein